MSQGRGRAAVLTFALTALIGLVPSAVSFADDDDEYRGKPEQPILHRSDRYVAKPAGTEEKLRFWFGPYVIPPGSDLNRPDIDLPLQNGVITSVAPKLRRAEDISEPSHQQAHIHHAHWFAVDPGNEEDNYTYGNTEWIFGTGDELTPADFSARSNADPKGPIYGQYIGAEGPQAMIYMLHNKTSQPLNAYMVLNVTFMHGTKEELAKLGRPFHDITGVLFGRTFDVPRNPLGDGKFTTTRNMEKPIEWTATHEGTMIGTGGHLHPGGTSVVVENLGSKENPCPRTGVATQGTLLLESNALWRNDVPYTEDFMMEVTHPHWRAPIHAGDRLRITGTYANKDNAWYTAMTHEGFYVDEAEAPKGRCSGYLINMPEPGVTIKKVKKKIVSWHKKRYRSKKSGRMRVKMVKKVRYKIVKTKIVNKRVDPTEGVPSRAWTKHVDRVCGVPGSPACDKPEAERPAGKVTSLVNIANFLYVPGDQSLSGDLGAPAQVHKGSSLTFYNSDQGAGIRHSVTTCRWPCNGTYVANYPLSDGIWDSTTLGYDAVDGGNPNPVASTPPELAVGKYSYYCRIHPWMRGAFEVIP